MSGIIGSLMLRFWNETERALMLLAGKVLLRHEVEPSKCCCRLPHLDVPSVLLDYIGCRLWTVASLFKA